MKKKSVIFSFCLFFLFNAICGFGQPGKRIPLLPPSHEIKDAENKIVTINLGIAAKQTAADALQPKSDRAKNIWENYHAPHANSPTDPGTSATCESYYQAYAALNNPLSALFDEIDALRQHKKDQEDLIENKKQEFLNQMIGKSHCAGRLSTFSTYDDMMSCWRCFFDGDCADKSNPVYVPGGTRAVPNQGSPIIFTEIKKELTKDIYVPPPVSNPPQKGYIEQATDKVRGFFQEIINSSQRLKNRVTAVMAVRG